MKETQPQFETKSAFVAIVGRPNVGKSSLLNALVGEKVAIVSSKPQTTRTRITGVLTDGDTQLVFIDTPGLHKPRTKLSEYMVRQVGDSVADVDVAVLVVEPGDVIQKAEQSLIDSFTAQRIPAVLVINKIDTLAEKEKLMAQIALFMRAYAFEAVVPVSALQCAVRAEAFCGFIAVFLRRGHADRSAGTRDCGGDRARKTAEEPV